MSNIREIEIWKDIEGYEGIYQISNIGRIKSLERIVYHNNGINRIIPEKIRKTRPDSHGYDKIDLYKEGKRNTFTIHRLMAIAFIPNPYNLPQVNHIDGIKENNYVRQLGMV